MRICKGWKTKVHWATAINWTAIKYIELESCYEIATIRCTINKICQWQPHQESKSDTFGQHKEFSTIIKIRNRKRNSSICSWAASPQQDCNWFCKHNPQNGNGFTWKPTKEIRSTRCCTTVATYTNIHSHIHIRQIRTQTHTHRLIGRLTGRHTDQQTYTHKHTHTQTNTDKYRHAQHTPQTGW